jgi:hypothetical protein
MKPLNPFVSVAGLFVMIAFGGCWKKSGEAIVVEKEYIAAGEELETPTPGPANSPSESAESVEYTEAPPLAEDEIVVDGYVMKKNLQGTSKDPRAHPGLEQWRIKVQLIDGGRSFTVRAEKAQFEKLKLGDRVKVRYREGKYTGSVWSAEILD